MAALILHVGYALGGSVNADPEFGAGPGGSENVPARGTLEYALGEAKKLLLLEGIDDCDLEFTCPGCRERKEVNTDSMFFFEHANFFTFGCGSCDCIFITSQRQAPGGWTPSEGPPLAAEAAGDEIRVPLQRIVSVIPGYLAHSEVWLRRGGDEPATLEEYAAAFGAFGSPYPRPAREGGDDGSAAELLFEVRNPGAFDPEAIHPDMRFAIPCDSFDLKKPRVPYPQYYPKVETEISDYIVLENGTTAWFMGD